jgi:uncharacterized lipoprotein YddW (UPF0748 family)
MQKRSITMFISRPLLKKKVHFFLLVAFLCLSGFLFESEAETSNFSSSKPRKGLWIEAEGVVRPFSDPLEFNKLLRTLNKHDVTDVYIQVYRNGKAWFPSRISDTTPYRENTRKLFHPIPKLIKFCKARNIRVHAWVNVLRMGEPDVPFLKYAGSKAVLHDGSGRSLIATKGEGVPGCRPDTPGIWLDPENQEVRKNTLIVIKELVQLYPDLSGIHFDYIRYPFPVAGEGSVKAPYCTQYMSASDLQKQQQSRAGLAFGAHVPDSSSSDNHHITNLLRIVRRYLDKKAPHLEVSGAVLSNIERAKKHGKQDWPLWLRLGLLDTVVTMNYTTDADRFLKESREGSRISNGRIMIGVGAWLSLSKPQALQRDLDNIRNLNTQGVVLFSYANLANPKGTPLFEALDAYSRVK